MVKKVIITILILLILISLGIIAYIIGSQNSNFRITNFWPAKSSQTQPQNPTIPNNFFPLATSSNEANLANNYSLTTNNQNPASSTITVPEESRPTLLEANGIGLIVTTDNKTERVLFIDRASGNIYEITANNDLFRLTADTLNNIRRVYWGKTTEKGGSLLVQSTQLNQGVTSVASIKFSTSTNNLGSLSTQILGVTIHSIAISPDRNKFFTLELASAGVNGYLNDWSNKNKKKVWSFPVGDWQATWPKNDLISLTTTPSASVAGYLYFLNPSTGSFSKILDNINGLTTIVSPDGQKVVFSRSELGKFTTYVYDLPSQKTSPLGLNTLPEKCTWYDSSILYCAIPKSITNSSYPDSWYQGKISFSDNIWKIDLKQKTTVLVSSPKSSYDLVNLVIAPKRGWLYAINKSNGSLQSFVLP